MREGERAFLKIKSRWKCVKGKAETSVYLIFSLRWECAKGKTETRNTSVFI